MDIEKFGNQGIEESIIKNPFKKQNITGISVYYEPKMFERETWEASARVDFKNGETSGTQKFKAKTFDEVVLEVKKFINNL